MNLEDWPLVTAGRQRQSVALQVAGAARPGRAEKACPCCKGEGSHPDGSECDPCDGSGLLHRGEQPEYCPGQPLPRRRHWRQASKSEMGGQAGDDFARIDNPMRRQGMAEDYHISHRPMKTGAPIHDIAGESPDADEENSYYGDDYYTHPRYYSDSGRGNHPQDLEALSQMRRVRGKPDAMVDIYRASHHSTPARVNHGDWVTLSPGYAHQMAWAQSGDDEPENQWVVRHARVPARHVRDAGSGGYREQGYWGPGIGSEPVQPGHHQASGDINSYRQQHEGPDEDQGEALHELGEKGTYPRDFYDRPSDYSSLIEHDETYGKIHRFRGRPYGKVTVYRSLPSPHREINTGDWVATAAAYARNHGRESHPDNDWPVVKATVRADQIRNDGNSLEEWSYHGPPIKRAVLHFGGGKNHRGKSGRGRTDSATYEHEPPEMQAHYSRMLSRAREQKKDWQGKVDAYHRGEGQHPGEFRYEASRHTADHGDPMIDLWHHTSGRNSAEIFNTKRFTDQPGRPLERDEHGRPVVFASTVPYGQASGYGKAAVHLRVPERMAQLDHEFPSGERHYRVRADQIRPEHFRPLYEDDDEEQHWADWRQHNASRDDYVVYHGAHHENVPSILARGLTPGTGSQTVTTSRDGAALYSGLRDWTAPKVIEMRIPHAQAGAYLGESHEGTPLEGTTYALKQTVPPSMIRAVHEASIRSTAARQAADPEISVEHRETSSGGASYPHMHTITATHPDGTEAELRYMLSKRNSKGVVDRSFIPGGYAGSLGVPLVRAARRLHPGAFIKGLPGLDEDWGQHLPSVSSLHRHLTVQLEPQEQDYIHDESVPRAHRAKFLMDKMSGRPSMHWASQRGRAGAEQKFGDHEFRSPEHTQIALSAAPPSPEHVETDPERISRNGGYAYQAPDWEVPLKEGAPVTVNSVRWRTGNTGWTRHQFKAGHQFTAARHQAGFEYPKAPGPLGEQGYRITEEGRGNYRDQSWYSYHMTHPSGESHGRLDIGQLGRYDDPYRDIHVEHIDVPKGHEGQGIASALMDHVYAEHPEPASVHHSLRTDEGSGWWDKYISSRPHIQAREDRQAQRDREEEERYDRHEASLMEHFGAASQYGPKPDYWGGHNHDEYKRLTDKDPDKAAAWYDERRDKERAWNSNIQRGLSLGHLSADEAKSYGYHASGHATESGTGRSLWQPMPQEMYHVTTDLPAVRLHGLKTRDELKQVQGHGLGGGEEDTISTTTSHEMAHHILRALHEFHNVVNGHYTPQQMWQHAKEGHQADHPFHHDIARYYQHDWKEGDELPSGLQDVMKGRETRRGGMLGTQEDMERHEGKGWTPGDEGIPHNRDVHYIWHRQLGPDRRREQAVGFYKNFAAHRSWAGGPDDPMFFSTDTKAFAQKDPKHFAILHVSPRPGAQGYPLHGMGEWRTGTGDALNVHHYETRDDQGLTHEAVFRRQAGMPHPDYDPGEEMPAGRGLFWRAHLRDRPFDEAHARSQPLNDQGRDYAGLRGYSAFRTPHQLGRYMDQMGWLDGGMMHGRVVIAFHGQQVGRGDDNEPLVIPKANPHCCGRVIHSQMPWEHLESKIWGADSPEVPHHQEYVSDPVPKAVNRNRRALQKGQHHEAAWHDPLDEVNWDEIHPGIEDIHRGIGVQLPLQLHRYVHDRRRKPADRAQALLEHVRTDPEVRDSGLGTHWTTDAGVAEDFGESAARHLAGDKHHGTSVVFHARAPGRGDIDEHAGDYGGVYHPMGHGEREIPLHGGASVALKGISWSPMSEYGDSDRDYQYTHHDFSEPLYHEASLMEHFAAGAYMDMPQGSGQMWRHLEQEHGIKRQQGSELPSAGFMTGLHGKFHSGQLPDRRVIQHQHDKPGPAAPGQGGADPISRFFTPGNRKPEPAPVLEPERLDDREYSIGDVSRRYDWEGFSSHEIGHLVHQPEHAVFTREDVPVQSLRQWHPDGRLRKPITYKGIARQGKDERDRLNEVEHGMDSGAVPPVVVVRDGRHHIIADGSHRAAIAAERGHSHIEAFVTGRTAFPERQASLMDHFGAAESLRNPSTGGREWYHGTRVAPQDMHGGLRLSQHSDGMEGHGHWNSTLGVHFAASHRMADRFARPGSGYGGTSSTHEYDPSAEHTPGVIHARLHLKNPKAYRSEHDMDDDAFEHEHGERKNYIGTNDESSYTAGQYFGYDHKHDAPSKGEWETFDDWGDNGETMDQPPPVYRRTQWLNLHPDRGGIARRFRERLQSQGHDGIIYGNEEPGERVRSSRPESNMVAVAFHPHQIEVTKHHRYGEGHADMTRQLELPFHEARTAFPERQASLMDHFGAFGPLQNPYTKGHEWYHGTRAPKEDFRKGFSEPFSTLEFQEPESETDDSGHWNRLLGTHFTADHAIADEFAKGEHSGSSNEGYGDDPWDEPGESVIHARLHLKNPKVYSSEHDMDHEAYAHEHAAGNHPINHLRDFEDDEEYGEENRNEMFPTVMRQHRDYGTDKIPDSTYGPLHSQFHGHPEHTAWLNTHPEKYEIAMRFKERLQDQGHDGVIYRNEYEKSNRGAAANTSAIVFDPRHAEITQHHHIDEPCDRESGHRRQAGQIHPDPQQDWYHGGDISEGDLSKSRGRIPAQKWLHVGTKQAALDRIDPKQYDPPGEFPYLPHARLHRVRIARGAAVCPYPHADPMVNPNEDFGGHGDYDVHAYTNEYEDPGSQSLVVRPSKVRYMEDLGRHPAWQDPETRRKWSSGRDLTGHQRGQEELPFHEAGKNGPLPELKYIHSQPDKTNPAFHELAAEYPEPDGRWAGMISWHQGEGWDSPTVHAVDVAEHSQRRGVGTELFRRAEQMAPGLQHSEKTNKNSKAWIRGMRHQRGQEELPFRQGVKYDIGPVRYSHHEESPGNHRFDAHDEWDSNIGYAKAEEKPDHVFLDSVYVRPGARGHGIASKLMDNVTSHFRGRDIRLKPHPFTNDQWDESGHEGMDEEDLRGFYQSKGFGDYERSPGDPLDSWEHMVRRGAWMPSQRIFAPTTCLDHRLFDGEQLKPAVRSAILERLGPVLEPVLGPRWQAVTRVYLAGSEASLWTDRDCEGNGDFDTLIGIAYSYARAAHAPLDRLSDGEIDKACNRALKEHYNEPGWHPPFDPAGTWDVTGYVNASAYDIRRIKAYAAYDLTMGEWAVKPPDLPEWGPEQFPQGPALFQQGRALISEVRAILRLPEPFRAQEARRIWDYIHAGRNADFSETGLGWQGTGNALEKMLDQASGHLVEKLKALVYAEEPAHA